MGKRSEIDDALNAWAGWLATLRLPLVNEKQTQAALENALVKSGRAFEREVRLSRRDIVDFAVSDGIIIELKSNAASGRAIERQLTRYADHDRVKGLVLLTNRAVALPRSIQGKPLRVVALGGAHL